MSTDYTDLALGISTLSVARDSNRTYYTRTVGPSSEPLSLDEAVRHLQLAVGNDNSYITSLIQVARDVSENATGRALMTSTWVAACRSWPCNSLMELTVSPVSAIASVKYYADGETTLTTLDSANYSLATTVAPAVVIFDEDFDAPDLADRPDAVQVTFTAGAATTAAIPPSMKHAVRLLLRHYYDHPEAVNDTKGAELPYGIKHLLDSNRISGWVA